MGQKGQLPREALAITARRLLLLDQVPLVDNDQAALATLQDLAGQMLVEPSGAARRVEHQDDDVRPFDAVLCAEAAVALDGGVDLRPPARAGGVDQHVVARLRTLAAVNGTSMLSRVVRACSRQDARRFSRH